MKDLFCSYEQALALKELGFDEPCFGFFDTFTNEVKGGNFPCEGSNKAPLKSQIFKWFGDEHNLIGCIDYSKRNNWCYIIREIITINDTLIDSKTDGGFNTYEQVQESCIDKLIEIIKEKK